VAENRTVKVTLKAEVAAYVANMMRGAQATSDLGKSATSAASDIDRALAQSEKAAKSSEQTFDRWGKVTKMAFAATALAAGGFFAAFLAQGVNANSFAEQNQIALTKMLGSTMAAKQALDEVYGLATETPFQFPELTRQYKNFVAAQLDLEKIIPLMRAYSSAVAALGGDNAQLAIVSDALQDMITLGKAQGDQLNRLTEQGIPAWKLLAEQMGVSVAEVQKLASEGMISADQAVDVLTAGMDAKFGSMLENMGDSYARWVDKAGSAQRRAAEQAAKPVMEIGKEVLKALTGIFNAVSAQLGEADWDPILVPLRVVPSLLDEIAERIASGDTQEVIDGVGTAFELFAAAAELAFNAALPLVDVLGAALAASLPLVQAATAISDAMSALPSPVLAAIAALGLIRTLHGPYARLISATTMWATSTRAAIAETARANQQISVGLATVNASTAAQGRLSAAMLNTRMAAAQMGVAVRGALFGAFGGPVGLAVAGALAVATLATTAWTDAQAQAEAAAQKSAAAVDEITAALDRNSGAFTQSAMDVVARQLLDQGLQGYLDDVGISLADFEGALYGSADAQSDFRARLVEMAQTDDLQAFLERTGLSLDDVISKLKAADGEQFGIKVAGLETLAPDAYAAIAALQLFDGQIGTNLSALERFRAEAELAGREGDFHVTPTVDSSQAKSALDEIRSAASKALASFVKLSPQKRKTSGGGGGGKSGEDEAVKAAKAEQTAIRKRTDAEKKAASDYEKAMQDRARAAREAADEAERAAKDAATAEEGALEKSRRAVDAYVAAQRQRQAIQRTLDAETDPARRAQLQQALADATDHEARSLEAKLSAEREAARATVEHTDAQVRAAQTVQESTTAQAEYEVAAAAAAATQERAAAQIEAAADRLAEATEQAAGRASGAMSGAADDAMESLDEWIARMWEQITAQSEWADNMVWLAGKASSGVVSQFMEMGQEGAYLLAELRESGGGQLAELERIAAATASGSKQELLSSMEAVGQVYPQIVARFGRKAADELTMAVAEGRVRVDDIMRTLKANYDGQRWTLGIDASTSDAIRAADSVVSYINNLRPKLTLSGIYGEIRIANGWSGGITRSKGGAIDGPGRKGKDSVPMLAAPGEHVLTAKDVDLMGGQQGVYEFRRNLARGSDTPPDVSAGAAHAGAPGGSGGTVIYSKVYYPLPEPASKAINRVLQREGG
jgi:tape measure domain-containing protein